MKWNILKAVYYGTHDAKSYLENKRSRRTCIAPLACIYVIFKQGIAGDINPLTQIYL